MGPGWRLRSGRSPFSRRIAIIMRTKSGTQQSAPALTPIWVGDTAAIFVGKAFGKTLTAPRISPKKTWEGALGNFVG
ncbi:MAG: phosphatidate cytidylyltransferase [Fimbriimonadales bacterium]